MSTVAIDIDCTLYDFYGEVREAFFEMAIEREDKGLLKGAYQTFNEWRELEDLLGIETALEAIHWVHDRQEEFEPFKHSVEVCQKIAKEHQIKYVTSRQQKYRESTGKWLWWHDFPLGELFCTEHDKSEYLTDCQYLIDDRPRTIANFIYDHQWKINRPDETRLAFGIWNSHNRNFTDIKNVLLAPGWRGLEFYLKRKGVITK